MIRFLIIIIFWLISLPVILFTISDRVAMLCIYHKLDTESSISLHELFDLVLFTYIVNNKSQKNKDGKETIDEKIFKVARCNGYINFPLLFSFFIILKNTMPGIDVNDAFTLALPITLVSLFILRVFANPNEKFRPCLCDITGINEADAFRKYEERVLSFYYSFICASLTVLLLMASYHVYKGGDLVTLVAQDITIICNAPNLNTKTVVIYLLGLGLITFISEWYLSKRTPVNCLDQEGADLIVLDKNELKAD